MAKTTPTNTSFMPPVQSTGKGILETLGGPTGDPLEATEREREAVAEAEQAEAEAQKAWRAKAGEYDAAAQNYNALVQRSDAGDLTAAAEVPEARRKASALQEQVGELNTAKLARKGQTRNARTALMLAELVAGVDGSLDETEAPARVEVLLVEMIEPLARLYVALEKSDRTVAATATALGRAGNSEYVGQADSRVQLYGAPRDPDGLSLDGRRFNTRSAHALTWALDRMEDRIKAKARQLRDPEVIAAEAVQAEAKSAREAEDRELIKSMTRAEFGPDTPTSLRLEGGRPVSKFPGRKVRKVKTAESN